jgi:hypothetical protein
MYSKEEKKNIKVEFWTSFGFYMKKHIRKHGNVHWTNYKTKIKDLYFRLEFNEKEAVFSIELQHPDSIRELFYEQFCELKAILEDTLNTKLIWEELYVNEFDKAISRIYMVLPDVNLFNKNDWQKVFVFFDSKMVKLHSFWIEYKEIFKNLES